MDLARVGREAEPSFKVMASSNGSSSGTARGGCDRRQGRRALAPASARRSRSRRGRRRWSNASDVRGPLRKPLDQGRRHQLLSYLWGAGEPFGFLLLDRSGLPLRCRWSSRRTSIGWRIPLRAPSSRSITSPPAHCPTSCAATPRSAGAARSSAPLQPAARLRRAPGADRPRARGAARATRRGEGGRQGIPSGSTRRSRRGCAASSRRSPATSPSRASGVSSRSSSSPRPCESSTPSSTRGDGSRSRSRGWIERSTVAYDINRCPQTEAEAQDYIYTIYQRTIGQPANDWAAVMQNSNLPRNVYTPGLKADGTWPMFGFTMMWSSGPRGRIFLPTLQADENGYYTRQIQVIDEPARRCAGAGLHLGVEVHQRTRLLTGAGRRGGAAWRRDAAAGDHRARRRPDRGRGAGDDRRTRSSRRS